MRSTITSAEQQLVAHLDRYLTLMAERKLDEASRFLALGARLVFPKWVGLKRITLAD